MNKIKYVRGTFATKLNKKGEYICNVPELAKNLLHWGDIPRNLSDGRAAEIALLAQEYLKFRRSYLRYRGKK